MYAIRSYYAEHEGIDWVNAGSRLEFRFDKSWPRKYGCEYDGNNANDNKVKFAFPDQLQDSLVVEKVIHKVWFQSDRLLLNAD